MGVLSRGNVLLKRYIWDAMQDGIILALFDLRLSIAGEISSREYSLYECVNSYTSLTVCMSCGFRDYRGALKDMGPMRSFCTFTTMDPVLSPLLTEPWDSEFSCCSWLVVSVTTHRIHRPASSELRAHHRIPRRRSGDSACC